MTAHLPRLKKLLLTLPLAPVMSFALAAEGEAAIACRDLGAEGQVAHAAEWICSVADVVNRLNLFSWMDGIAWAVLIAFFVARVLMISLDPNAGPKLRNHLIASFLAFGLMLSMTPIRSAMLDVWRHSYTFSQSHGADAVWHTLAVLAEDLGQENVAATLTGLAVADQMGDPVFDLGDKGELAAGGTVLTGSAAAAHRIGKLSTIAKGLNGAKNLLKGIPIFRIVDAILLPVMSLYSMMVFGSALTIIIGAFLLPVGAIMLVAGAGSGFFSNWGNVMIASVITMVVFPLMWGVTTQVAFVTPLTSFLGAIGEMSREYDAALKEIADRPFTVNPIQYLGNQIDMAMATFGAGATFVGQLMTMVVQMVIGLITAIGLIFLLQKVVTAFISGIVVQGNGLMKTLGLRHGSGGKGSNTKGEGAGSGAGASGTAGGGGGGSGNTKTQSDDTQTASNDSGTGPARGAKPLTPASPTQTGVASVTQAGSTRVIPSSGLGAGPVTTRGSTTQPNAATSSGTPRATVTPSTKPTEA